jgi:hypothetical protein
MLGDGSTASTGSAPVWWQCNAEVKMADGKGTSGWNQRGREIWPNRKDLSSFYALRGVATGRSAAILSTIGRPERRFHQANWNAMLVVESFARPRHAASVGPRAMKNVYVN